MAQCRVRRAHKRDGLVFGAPGAFQLEVASTMWARGRNRDNNGGPRGRQRGRQKREITPRPTARPWPARITTGPTAP
jgi:hypothetical protein